jgi:TetR/AcrR family transcriptional regulator, tetracycline repressor protein
MAIERDKILDAALALLNEVGLDQLTTRKLAERLGVQQPALYWHFKSKSALLDALNEVVLERFHERRFPRAGERWDEFTIAHARSFRKALLAVRDGARLNAGTRPSAHQFADAERELELYVAAGFTPTQALSIALGVARYVTGFVLEEQDERERAGDESDWGGGDPLHELAPFPLLSEAIKPMIEGGAINTETVFERGLSYMVAGIKASVEAKTIGRRSTERNNRTAP